jgi:hypothetical protein
MLTLLLAIFYAQECSVKISYEGIYNKMNTATFVAEESI